jgi:hypothetical protein
MGAEQDDPRHLKVDISKIDLDAARTEALRLLAAPEADPQAFTAEAARVATAWLDDLDLDGVDDKNLELLLHRIIETIAGLSVVGYGAVSIASEAHGIAHLDVLAEIERRLEEPDEAD